jgi:murein DD-endopeptidase MepM/ murein hydrolase activator NlpD
MRSYTLTLRPEGIKGKFRSFNLKGRTLLCALFGAVCLLTSSTWMIFTGVVVPYGKVSAGAAKANRISEENRALAEGIAEKRALLERLGARVTMEFALVDKVDTLLGGGEWEAGGYPRLAGDRVQNILSKLDYLERRLADHERFADLVELMPIRLPIRGGFDFASGFGPRRSPFAAGIEMHNGIDLAAPEGTVVLAAGSGVVSLAGRWTDLRLPEYGRLGLFVRLEHGETGYSTIYGHCSRLLVRQGDRVSAGQPIALVGNTGWSTSPHLHFAICKGEEYFDPRDYLLFFDTRSLYRGLIAGAANR